VVLTKLVPIRTPSRCGFRFFSILWAKLRKPQLERKDADWTASHYESFSGESAAPGVEPEADGAPETPAPAAAAFAALPLSGEAGNAGTLVRSTT